VPVLSKRVAFWTAAAVVTMSLWASSAPSMIYPLYIEEWGLNTAVTTGLFSTYPLCLVIATILFGGISDYVGRKRALLIGIGLVVLGVTLFALGPNIGWLFAGRAFQGFGVGVALSAASAAMAEFEPSGNRDRASTVNALASSTGMALAVVVGGALVEYAPLPTRLGFFVLLFLGVIALIMLAMFPKNEPGTLASGGFRVTGPKAPKGVGLVVLLACLAGAASYASGSLILGLGAQIAKDLIDTENALLAGASIGIFSVFIAVGTLVSRNWPPVRPVIVGGLIIAAGMALLYLSSDVKLLPLYFFTCAFAGFGNGQLFLASISLVNRFAPPHHRAGMFSSVYLAAYLFQGAVPFAAGLTSTAIGFGPAIHIWVVVIAGIGILTSVAALVIAPRLPWQAAEPGHA
jgi:MFS family permease